MDIYVLLIEQIFKSPLCARHHAGCCGHNNDHHDDVIPDHRTAIEEKKRIKEMITQKLSTALILSHTNDILNRGSDKSVKNRPLLSNSEAFIALPRRQGEG